MLSTTAMGLIVVWLLALFCSVTLGGWIHLLPVVAAPLLLFRALRRQDVPSDDYRKWEHALPRRRR